MTDKYIEVTIMQDGYMLTDWSDWFQHHIENNNYIEMSKQSTGWNLVRGNHVNYWIRGLGKNEKRNKSFAIWYHTNKASGNIRTYRLD